MSDVLHLAPRALLERAQRLAEARGGQQLLL